MSINLIEIPIKGIKRTLICVGSGENICHIVGPGSFYLKSLIYAGLAEKFTFTTCDPWWANYDSSDNSAVETYSLENIIDFEHEVLQAIKHHFKYQKIGMLGFSAPGCIATSYVIKHPEDIAWLSLAGIPIQGTDSNFAASDKNFRKYAEKNRVQQFLLDQKDLFDKAPSFYTFKTRKKTPTSQNSIAHSKWLLETMALYQKAFFYDKIQYRYAFLEHWKENFLGLEMNQKFRQHFFDSILPEIDTLSNLTSINSAIPIKIFHGEEDYITPLNSEVAKTLTSIQSIELINYKQCGHCLYIENPKGFYHDMLRP